MQAGNKRELNVKFVFSYDNLKVPYYGKLILLCFLKIHASSLSVKSLESGEVE